MPEPNGTGLDVNVLKRTNELLAGINETLGNIPSMLSGVTDATGKTKKAVDSTTDSANKLGASISEMAKEAKDKVSAVGGVFNGLAKSIEKAIGVDIKKLITNTSALSAATFMLGNAARMASEDISTFGNSIDSVGNKTAKVASTDFANLSGALKALADSSLAEAIPGINQLTGAFLKMLGILEQLYKPANSLREFENSLIGARA